MGHQVSFFRSFETVGREVFKENLKKMMMGFELRRSGFNQMKKENQIPKMTFNVVSTDLVAESTSTLATFFCDVF